MNPITRDDIVCHGRSFASGLFVFTCYAFNLGQFRTDAETEGEAWEAALAYFNSHQT